MRPLFKPCCCCPCRGTAQSPARLKRTRQMRLQLAIPTSSAARLPLQSSDNSAAAVPETAATPLESRGSAAAAGDTPKPGQRVQQGPGVPHPVLRMGHSLPAAEAQAVALAMARDACLASAQPAAALPVALLTEEERSSDLQHAKNTACAWAGPACWAPARNWDSATAPVRQGHQRRAVHWQGGSTPGAVCGAGALLRSSARALPAERDVFPDQRGLPGRLQPGAPCRGESLWIP